VKKEKILILTVISLITITVAVLVYQLNVKTLPEASVEKPMQGSNIIEFSGIKWIIKSSNTPIGPGPNIYSADNVYVNEQGELHLAIKCDGGVCTCAEVYTVQKYRYGVFEFKINGDSLGIDRNAVFGLFLYYDNKHEIDVEISRWGARKSPNVQFVVQPYYRHPPHRFDMPLTGDDVIFIIKWEPHRISFRAYLENRTGDRTLVEEWSIKVKEKKPMRIHLNLWLIDLDGNGVGDPPAGDGALEVIVKEVSQH